MVRAPTIPLLGLLLVAACTGSSVGTTDPESTAGAGVLLPNVPLLTSDQITDADHLLVGAVTEDQGAIHAWIVAFGANTQHVVHLSWTDGTTEVSQEDSHLSDLDLPLAEPGPIPTSVDRDPDGTWVMYGWGQPQESGSSPILWRATAMTSSGPWANDPGPFFGVGEPTAWDGGWIDFPAVTRIGNDRLMVYEGASTGATNRSQLGVASSGDGVDFTRPSTPSLSPQQCDNTRSIRMPRLVGADAGYLLGLMAVPTQSDDAPIVVSAIPDLSSMSCDGGMGVIRTSDLEGSAGLHSFGLYQSAAGPTLLVESLAADAASSDLWLIPIR